MQKIIFKETGNPEEVLSIVEEGIDMPSDNEVQVKIMARPINPSDEMFIKGIYRIKPEFPQTAGLEAAGIIELTGNNIDPLLIGKHVSFRTKGTWADKINVPVHSIRIIPESIPFETACQLSLNTITAYALLQEAAPEKDSWILLNAANSSVGKQVIQMAAVDNINVIALVRKNEQKEELLRLGVKKVINTETEDLIKETLEIAPTGVNAVLDAVGGLQASRFYKVLAPFAKVLIYGRLSNEPVSYMNGDIIYKNVLIKGFGIDAWLQQRSTKEIDDAWDYIINNLMAGKLKPGYEKKYPLAEFKNAITEYQRNSTRIILN